MLIILDLGANDGCSILKFQDMLKDKNIEEYKIYSFEPNIFFKKPLKRIKKRNTNIEIYFKILGTKNTTTKLYLSQKNNSGSSIYSNKTTNKVNDGLYLNCQEIDIVEFLRELPSHDELWIKMDIEGGEYDIIPYLHKNDCLKLINKLFIEWHYKKIPSITEETHNKVRNLVSCISTEFWDAYEYGNKSKHYITEYKNFLEKVKKL